MQSGLDPDSAEGFPLHDRLEVCKSSLEDPCGREGSVVIVMKNQVEQFEIVPLRFPACLQGSERDGQDDHERHGREQDASRERGVPQCVLLALSDRGQPPISKSLLVTKSAELYLPSYPWGRTVPV